MGAVSHRTRPYIAQFRHLRENAQLLGSFGALLVRHEEQDLVCVWFSLSFSLSKPNEQNKTHKKNSARFDWLTNGAGYWITLSTSINGLNIIGAPDSGRAPPRCTAGSAVPQASPLPWLWRQPPVSRPPWGLQRCCVQCHSSGFQQVDAILLSCAWSMFMYKFVVNGNLWSPGVVLQQVSHLITVIKIAQWWWLPGKFYSHWVIGQGKNSLVVDGLSVGIDCNQCWGFLVMYHDHYPSQHTKIKSILTNGVIVANLLLWTQLLWILALGITSRNAPWYQRACGAFLAFHDVALHLHMEVLTMASDWKNQ